MNIKSEVKKKKPTSLEIVKNKVRGDPEAEKAFKMYTVEICYYAGMIGVAIGLVLAAATHARF